MLNFINRSKAAQPDLNSLASKCRDDPDRISNLMQGCSQEHRVVVATLVAHGLTRGGETGGEYISKHIRLFGIESQSALIEIAKIAAARDGPCTSQFISNYGIQDQSALIEIAKIAISGGRHPSSGFISNYGIQDQSALIEIAKIAATREEHFSGFIFKYGIQDPSALIEIAKIVATHGGSISASIQFYGIKDQSVLIEIAKIAATHGDRISPYIHYYGIKDQSVLIEIAKIAAAHNPGNASAGIKNYGIKDQSVLIEIAKIAAAHSHRDDTAIAQSGGMSYHIGNYGIEDQSVLIEIAKIAAAHSPVQTSRSISHYGIKDQSALIEIARIAAAQNGPGTLEFLHRAFAMLPPREHSEEVINAIKQSSQALASFHEYSGLFPERETTIERAHDVAQWLKASHPKFTDRLSDCFKEVQGVETLPEALALTIKHWDSLDQNSDVNLSRQALIKEFGIDLPTKELSNDSSRKLYETILSTKLPLKEFIAVSKEAWANNTDTVLDCISYISALRGMGASFPKLTLNSESLHKTKSNVEEALSVTFAEVMGLESENLKVGDLLSKWGDLTPITTLAGRYKGGSVAEQKEFLVLREICLRVLDGSFHDWKYNHEHVKILEHEHLKTRDKPKLSRWHKEFQVLKEICLKVLDGSFPGWKYERKILDKAKSYTWRENPSSLQLHSTSFVKQENPFEHAKTIFSTNLLAHVPADAAVEFRETKEVKDELINIPENRFAKAHTLASCLAVINHLLMSNNTDKLREFLSKFNSSKSEILKGISEAEAKQIGNDITSIKDAITTKKVNAGKQYLVFSTITDDPKLLLTVGDLVNTASCQNSRTGSGIQCLPAYVMDHNIKAVLSFPIAWGQIQALFGKDVWAEDFTYEFDAPKLKLTLKTLDKEREIYLGKAVRRSILRLGTSTQTSQAALCVERPYLQTHAVMPQIQMQEEQLLALVTSGIGATREGRMTFPASRNPAGVYSDAAGGIRKGRYSI